MAPYRLAKDSYRNLPCDQHSAVSTSAPRTPPWAWSANGQPRLVALEDGQVTLPSAVFFNFEDNRTCFGRHAIANYTDSIEGRLMRSLKSVLGSSLVHEKTRIKSRSIGFMEIVGLFVGHLRKKAGGRCRRCGRDAWCSAGRCSSSTTMPKPTRRPQSELENAARAQGFKHIAFQFEPIAAALDYEQKVTREELALIVDMGGGTSDFSIVRVSPQRSRSLDRKDDILASRGIHIGGTDFDRLLSIAHVMPQLGYLTPTKDGKRNLPASYFIDLATWQRINLVYTARAMTHLRQIRYEAERADLVDRFIHIVEHRYGHALAALVERAKIELTDESSARCRGGAAGRGIRRRNHARRAGRHDCQGHRAGHRDGRADHP